MTLLTHTGRPFERAPYSSAKREQTRAANAHLAMIKRVCLIVLTSLLAIKRRRRHHRFEDGGLSLALYPLTREMDAGCDVAMLPVARERRRSLVSLPTAGCLFVLHQRRKRR